jgi:hypothetical protein
MAEQAAQYDRWKAAGTIAERPDATILLLDGAQGRHAVRKMMATPVFAMRARSLFTQRLHILTRLHHPHVAAVLAGHINRRDCLAYMEYAPRGALFDAVGTARRLWTLPLPPLEAVRLTHEIAEGVQAMHGQGIIHGGLKLGNVLLVAGTDGQWQAKVTDALLHEGFVNGTLRTGTARPTDLADPWLFLAPEQYAGRAELASDQYALAVIAFLLLTGETPFTLDPVAHLQAREAPPYRKPHDLNPVLPVALDAVLWRGLSRAPKARYPTVRAFAQALASAIGARDATRTVSIAPGSIPLLPGGFADAAPPAAIAQAHEKMSVPLPLALRNPAGSIPIPGLPDLPPDYAWSEDVVKTYRALEALPELGTKRTTRRRVVPRSAIVAVSALLVVLAATLFILLALFR